MKILVALRRKKDNPDEITKGLCFRQIYNSELDVKILKMRCRMECGNWRLYITVNERNELKALHELQHKLIDCAIDAERLNSQWKSILLNPRNKDDNKWLLDIDNTGEEYFSMILAFLRNSVDAIIYNKTQTPNGFHVIVDRFDNREFLKRFPDVTIKKDALFYLESFS